MSPNTLDIDDRIDELGIVSAALIFALPSIAMAFISSMLVAYAIGLSAAIITSLLLYYFWYLP